MKAVITIAMLVILISSEARAQGARIEVPGDQPTIQAGILAASDGDTVLVAPGTYPENINFRGKNIVVASRYVLSGDPAHIESTIIDGGSPAHPDTASCVLIVSGEDSTAVLQGFTLSGGTGTKWVDEHGAGTYFEGGGILITLSSPTILSNLIIGNTAIRITSGVTSAGGGGIRVGDGNPRIVNNVIMDNEGMYGGGIVLNYTGAVIRNNVIYNNRAYRPVPSAPTFGGGGLLILENFAGAGKLLENNIIAANSSSGSGASPAGRGGAFVIWNTTVTARNNIIWGNTQTLGGQIMLLGGNVSLSYSAVEGGYSGIGNISSYPSFADSGLYLLPGSACVDAGDSSSIFDDPEDAQNPGFAKWPSLGGLRNDIGVYGGPDRRVLARFFLSRLILGTSVNFGTIAPGDTAVVNLTLRNPGTAGLQIDSVFTFLQGDVEVLTAVPFLIDPVSNTSIVLEWTPESEGVLNDTLYVFHQAENLPNPVVVSLSGEAILTSVGDPAGIPGEFRLGQNFPNPFNPSTTIRYTVPKKADIRISVYNSLGEKVTDLVKSVKLPGEYEVVWNAKGVASGIYFYRLESDEFTITKKLLLIK